MSSLSKHVDSKSQPDNNGSNNKKRGWDEIANIFDNKKKEEKQRSDLATQETLLRKARRRQCKEDNVISMGKVVASKKQYRDQTSNSGNTFKCNNNAWVDDGLGGKYNDEGYTGRVEDGLKIFKAHVLSKPNAGQTPDCPFDCDCCYI
jgi:hypothetical protein